ncbi:protein of unknown function DUF862, eukaryotic [Cynara cardunculus var. scolymus]|uniref:PPPDE domain-containing protein n=1 Tax=Cynara cardunculus var. scolymus TaxID=59895 RepID=A0A103XND7_CYNCS|nr:protein of unknown function DUF862, eukaryotic [Cynara cardunculus var. scolymus]
MGSDSCLSSNCATVGTSDSCVDKEIFLNVYDLTPFNSYSIWLGFGIFHTGIEVYGMEYGFGAHDYPISGVFEVEPKSCPGFIYRTSISLGHIGMTAGEFREFIETMASDYHGDTYHLISKNCNHFTDDISQRLTGKRIPGWVNRLAKLDDDGSDSGSSVSSHEGSESDVMDQKVLLSPTPTAEVAFIKEIPR